MEKDRKLFEMLVAEKEFSGTYEQFHEGFKDPAKQAALHKALTEKEYVDAPLEQWQSKWFGEGEKKKPEAQQTAPQVAATSPAPGQQSGTASKPTDDQGIAILPPETEKPSVPKASQQDMVKELLAKPTKELLFNYASNTMGELMPVIETPEQQKQVKDLLYRLNVIRSQPGSDMAKLAEAQREIARSSSEAGWAAGSLNQFVDQYATTMGIMERQDPKAYREHMDKRLVQASSQRGEDEVAYKQNILINSIGDVFDPESPEAQEALKRVGYEKYKTSDPQRAQALLDEAEQIRANRVGELEQAIVKAEEAVAMMPGSNKGALDQIKALKQERLEFLNPSVKANKVYAAMEGEMSAVPGSTPQEKMRNYYQQLLQEKRDLMSMQPNSIVHGLIESTAGGTTAASARKNEIDGRLKALAPVVFLNQAPIQEDSFLSNIGPAFGKAILGGTLEGDLRMNKQELSGHVLRAMQVAGVSEQDLQPGALEMTKKRMEANGLGDGAYWGELLGSSAGLALPLMVGGAATAGLKAPKVITSKPLLNMVFNAAKSGASYELSAQFSKDQSDELTFLGGFTGGIGKELAGSAIGAMGRTAIGNVFGNKAPEAVKAVTRFGAARAGSGVGETAEEFGQTIAQIAQSSDTFQEFKAGFAKQFPDWSEAAKFAISTMVMGMAMGGGNEVGTALAQEGQALVDALPADEAVAVKTALQQLAEESTGATQEMVAEAQAEPEMTPEEKAKAWVEDEFARQEAEIAAEKAANAPSPTVEWTGESVTAPATTEAGGQPVESAEAVAPPTMEESTPAAELASTVKEIAGANPEDVKLLTEGFAELFGEGMSIDVGALSSMFDKGGEQKNGGESKKEIQEETGDEKRAPINLGGPFTDAPGTGNKPITITIDTAKKEAIVDDPSIEESDKIANDAEKKVQEKKGTKSRPKQEAFPAGKILTEYAKSPDGVYRLTQYMKDEKGNWMFRNAASGDTPMTKNPTFKRGWQPITNTPQARDHIESLASSPARTDLVNAINELKAARSGAARVGAISDPWEVARRQKRVIDAAVNVGAQLIKVGVTDFGDWMDSMAKVTGDAIRKQPELAKMIYNAAKAKLVAEEPEPKVQSEKPKTTAPVDTQTEPKQQAPVQPSPQADTTSPEKSKTAETPKTEIQQAPKPVEDFGTQGGKMKEAGVSRLLAKYSRPGVVKAIVDASPIMYQVSSQSEAIDQAVEEIEADGIEESFAKVIADPGYSDVLSAKYQILIDTYGRMGDEAVRDGDKATLAEISARIRALEQVVSRKATLGGQFNAMLAMYQSISGAAAPYLNGLITEFNAGILEKKRSGIPIKTLIENITKEVNDAKRGMASQIAGDARVDASIDGTSQSASSEPKKSIKDKIREKKAEALAEYNAGAKKIGGNLGMGANPMGLAPLIKLGYYTVLDGAVTFTAWAAEMIKLTGITKAQAQEVWEAEHEGKTVEQHAQESIRAAAVSKTLTALAEPVKREPSEKTKATAAFKEQIREIVKNHIASPDGRMLEQVLMDDAGLSTEDAAKVAEAVSQATRDRLGKFVKAKLDSVAKGAANQEVKPKTSSQIAAERAERAMMPKYGPNKAPDTNAAAIYSAIRSIVAAHVENPGDESLESKLEAGAGLTPAEATRVANAVNSTPPALVSNFTNGKQKVKRTKADAILDMLVNAPVSSEAIKAAVAQKLGLRPDLTDEQYMEIQRLGVALRGTPPGSITQQNAAWELAGAIAPLVPIAWWKKGLQMWRSLAYFSLLFRVTTHVKNVMSAMERMGIGNFTTIVNPAKWARAISVYNGLEGPASKKTQAAFLASPVSEAVFKIAWSWQSFKSGRRAFVSSISTGQGVNIYDDGISADNLLKSRPFFENQKGVIQHAKWIGRSLAAEDAMMRGYYQDQEAVSDLRYAMAQEGFTWGQTWDTISTKLDWKGAAFQEALSQAKAEATAWEEASGKAMPETMVISRARQILKMQVMAEHGVDPKGASDVAAYNTFTLRRNGIFSKVSHLLNRGISSTAVTEFLLRPYFPFVEIVANLCDGMVDAVPVYGMLRAAGATPTTLISKALGTQGAQLGEKGSTLRAAQWERAMTGFYAFAFLGGLMMAGDKDDKEEDKLIGYKGTNYPDSDQKYHLMVLGKPILDMRNFPSLFLSFEAIDHWKTARKDRLNTDSELKKSMFAILASLSAIKDMSFLESVASLEKNARDVMTIIDQKGTAGEAADHMLKSLLKDWSGFYMAPIPTNWGLVQQVWNVADPEKPASGSIGEILCYNLGISRLTNTKRVDSFGNIVEGYPGNDVFAVNSWALPKDKQEQKLYQWLSDNNITLAPPINRKMKLIDDKEKTGFVQRRCTPKEWEEFLLKSGKAFKEDLQNYIDTEAASDESLIKVTQASTKELIATRVSEIRSAAQRRVKDEMFGDALFESGIYEASELGF